MKKIINIFKNFVNKIRYNNNPPMLGRWNIKKCNNNMTNINSVYQNRDHCGDIICKNPIKASEYNN
jgi:hypothetical protein